MKHFNPDSFVLNWNLPLCLQRSVLLDLTFDKHSLMHITGKRMQGSTKQSEMLVVAVTTLSDYYKAEAIGISVHS